MSGPLGFGGGGGGGGGGTTVYDILNAVPLGGTDRVFTLRRQQSLATATYASLVTDDIELLVAGQYLAPYVVRSHLPWIVEYDSFNGFRVISGSRMIVYNAPVTAGTGLQSVRVVRSVGAQTARRYPFAPTTIAFGE